ncbi:Uncharacterized protein HZ326_1411 [Fusarium oxysporum f. sp. albedinis]|nr:Uncharacterized protein HZ326_1411 [Fusarium oxysporum f. sp. albedinis]
MGLEWRGLDLNSGWHMGWDRGRAEGRDTFNRCIPLRAEPSGRVAGGLVHLSPVFQSRVHKSDWRFQLQLNLTRTVCLKLNKSRES